MIDTTASVNPFKPWTLPVTSAIQIMSVRMIPVVPRRTAPTTDVYADPLTDVGPVRSGSLRRVSPR